MIYCERGGGGLINSTLGYFTYTHIRLDTLPLFNHSKTRNLRKLKLFIMEIMFFVVLCGVAFMLCFSKQNVYHHKRAPTSKPPKRLSKFVN